MNEIQTHKNPQKYTSAKLGKQTLQTVRMGMNKIQKQTIVQKAQRQKDENACIAYISNESRTRLK